jgi:hypothetical protein
LQPFANTRRRRRRRRLVVFFSKCAFGDAKKKSRQFYLATLWVGFAIQQWMDYLKVTIFI